MTVEVDVSQRCQHDCFSISMGSRGIWRFSGLEPIDAEPETSFIIHSCDEDCLEECWEV